MLVGLRLAKRPEAFMNSFRRWEVVRDGSSPFTARRVWYVNFKKRFLAVNTKLPGKTALAKPTNDLLHFVIHITQEYAVRSSVIFTHQIPST